MLELNHKLFWNKTEIEKLFKIFFDRVMIN